jgi:hypothetical protein
VYDDTNLGKASWSDRRIPVTNPRSDAERGERTLKFDYDREANAQILPPRSKEHRRVTCKGELKISKYN